MKNFAPFLLISFLLHLFLPRDIFIFNQSIEIKKENLKKLRTITLQNKNRLIRKFGAKSGRKKYFSLPNGHLGASPQKDKDTLNKKENLLKSLGSISEKELRSLETVAPTEKPISKNKLSFSQINKQNIIQGFHHPNLDIHFELPQGVPLDDLNKKEMKFFSFNKRVYETYVTSIYKIYNEFKSKDPYFDLSTLGNHLLISKITFTKKGIIHNIENLSTSSNEKLQFFFSEVLKQLLIPNPPKEIVKNDHFQFDFQLSLN